MYTSVRPPQGQNAYLTHAYSYDKMRFSLMRIYLKHLSTALANLIFFVPCTVIQLRNVNQQNAHSFSLMI
jgi:hypothetical protein